MGGCPRRSGPTRFVQPSDAALQYFWWSGSVATIPFGFDFADGTAGTVDLRNSAIIAALQDDAGVAKATIRGSLAIQNTLATHIHTSKAGNNIIDAAGGGDFAGLIPLTMAAPPEYALPCVLSRTGQFMVPGLITMWSGSVATIPAGYAFCDGTQGTPDLRDQFVIAALQDDAGVAKATIDGALAQTGGNATHDHTLPAGTEIIDSDPAGNFDSTLVAAYNYPPCYALAFIMKL